MKAEPTRSEAVVSASEAMIAGLKLAIALLKREKYGRRSERAARLIHRMELQLEGWQGILQADAHAGYNQLHDPARQPGPSGHARSRQRVFAPWRRRQPRHRFFSAREGSRKRQSIEPGLSGFAKKIPLIFGHQIAIQDRMDAALQPDDLFEPPTRSVVCPGNSRGWGETYRRQQPRSAAESRTCRIPPRSGHRSRRSSRAHRQSREPIEDWRSRHASHKAGAAVRRHCCCRSPR
ncbi:MAG: hypothetical protein R3F54_19325 [Alphaproteobacteria bacterium]